MAAVKLCDGLQLHYQTFLVAFLEMERFFLPLTSLVVTGTSFLVLPVLLTSLAPT